jgi:hypothetical protein
MPGPRNTGSNTVNTYTCTCTHFCGGYKTGLSRATYYRHAPYRDAARATSSFSSSFQSFLHDSAGSGVSGQLAVGQEESQGNTDDLETEIPTSPHVLDASGSIHNFEETARVSFSI